MPPFRITLFVILSASSGAASTQNLVPNPSFEDTAHCDGPDFSWIEAAPPWYTPNLATPDVFTFTTDSCGIPFDAAIEEVHGWPVPTSGYRIAGVIAYAFNKPGFPETKEYLAVKLTESLQAGTTYDVGMNVRLGKSCQYAIARMSAHFSADSLSFADPFVIGLAPTVQLYGGTPFLDNTTTWQWVGNSFVAQGGERYMILGCFDDSTEVDILERPGWYNSQTYYFIDDVEVVAASPQGMGELSWRPSGSGFEVTWTAPGALERVLLSDALGRLVSPLDVTLVGPRTLRFRLPASVRPGVYQLVVQVGGTRQHVALWHRV